MANTLLILSSITNTITAGIILYYYYKLYQYKKSLLYTTNINEPEFNLMSNEYSVYEK